MTDTALDIMERLDQAARLSEPGPGVTRLYLTPEHRAVANLVAGWMEEAGLTVRMDAAGTVVGRLAGPSHDAPTLILGSHVDTVINGGKYDGMLGVVLPIVAVEQLKAQGAPLPYAVEVVAFGDEEGVRFPTTLIGSRALAGALRLDDLDVADRDGVKLVDAMREFGLDPQEIPAIARDPARTLGYVEVHIEQGPVLEEGGLPVGIVTAITGIERHTVTFTGKASHAGTTPMETRKDALAAAAEAILEIEQTARDMDGLVATVGSVEIAPNAINVVPGVVELGLDLRSPDAGLRHATRTSLLARFEEIAGDRGIGFSSRLDYEQEGVTCAPRIVDTLERAVATSGHRPLRLFSGAGHDTLAMAALTDVGMIFVRCRDGLSHHPDESITGEDAAAAADVLVRFMKDLRP